MTEAVAFPDVEALLVTALDPLFSVPVATRVPNPRPDSFVRLTRTGGTRRDLVTDASVVVFEAWAPTEVAASALARELRARVGALAATTVGADFVRRVDEIAGPQAFPDPVSGRPRYQFTAQIHTRGAAL